MSSTALTLAPGGELLTVDALDLIAGSGKAASTKDKYTRALAPYVEAGGSLADVHALGEYAGGLSLSRRRHLKSAVNLWAHATQTLLKAHDTPERHTATAAALNRLDAITETLTVEPTKGTKAHTWLTESQIVALEATCGDDITGLRDRVALGLLVGAGLRRAELARAKWADLVHQPFEGELCTVLNVIGKGSKAREMPLTEALADLLADWAEWTGREGCIVRSLGRALEIGDSLSAVGVFRIVRKHGTMIGLPTLAAHDLRRTFAQRVWENTHDLLLVADLLGHASIETSRRYLELDQAKKREAVHAIPWGRR